MLRGASLPPSAPCPSLGTSIREPVGYRLQEVDLRYKGGQRSSDHSYGTPPALSRTRSRRFDLLAPMHSIATRNFVAEPPSVQKDLACPRRNIRVLPLAITKACQKSFCLRSTPLATRSLCRPPQDEARSARPALSTELTYVLPSASRTSAC